MQDRARNTQTSPFQNINIDHLDPAAISALIEKAKSTLDKLTAKHGSNLSPLEKAQKDKNFKLLNEYYSQAVDYYKSQTTNDVDTTTIDGIKHRRTILFWAIACHQNAETIESLISKGSKADEAYYDDNYRELPAFTIALKLGNCDAMRVLLTHDKSLVTQRVNEYGLTPAHYAAEHNKLKILSVLFEASPYITRVPAGPLELTPLHTAATLGQPAAAKWLLEHDNAVCDLRDSTGYTALHFAIIGNHGEIVRLLLDHDADIRLTTKPFAKHPNKTALQLAAESGNNEVVQLLMQHSARPDTEHPVDSSRLNENLRIAFALLEYCSAREKKPEYFNTLFGYNTNPLAWPKGTKMAAAMKVVNNIISDKENPFIDLNADELGSLRSGDINKIVNPLLMIHAPKSPSPSQSTSEESSPLPSRYSPNR